MIGFGIVIICILCVWIWLLKSERQHMLDLILDLEPKINLMAAERDLYSSLLKLHSNIHKSSSEMQNTASVAKKFKQIKDITEKQLNLDNSIETPNASASHSRYKNELVKQYKKLEDEKHAIFRKMISEDNVNPVVSVITKNGNVEQMRLSEILKMADEVNPEKPEQAQILRLVPKEEPNDPSPSKTD